MSTQKMKAAICTGYGAAELIHIKYVTRPEPGENGILVKIMASSVNSGDVRVRGLQAGPVMRMLMRCLFGFCRPRRAILGTTYSGIVEAVGKHISSFKPGDQVYGITGLKFGAHAEYIVLTDKDIFMKKPVNATFEEAAALPFGGHTAIHFLKKAGIAQNPRARVLIYGATGSVGTSAIQIANYYGADVTAACSRQGLELVRELGIKKTLIYDDEAFKTCMEKFDVIFDAVGKITKKQCAHLLKSDAKFLTVGGFEVAAERKEDLEFLSMLFGTGRYKAAIDRVYALDAVAEAHSYVDSGRKKGNVVLKIGDCQHR